MKSKLLFSMSLGLCFVLSSCTESETTRTESYQWGLAITRESFSAPESDNLLYKETKATLEEFCGKYNGSGICQSDDAALEQAKYTEAINAHNEMTAKIKERIRVFDNWKHKFTFVTRYGIYKGLDTTPIKEEINVTFENNNDIKLWYLYTSTITVPLTEELKKKDPATYRVVVPLTECGVDGFEAMTSFRYNSVKVYSSSTKLLNEESSFISGGEISLKDKTLTLVFTGTGADLAKMKGEWSANVYATITSDKIVEKDLEALIKVPFTIK